MTSSETIAQDAPGAGTRGPDGADGKDRAPASPTPPEGLKRVEILSQDFTIDSVRPNVPLAATIPEAAARILMALDYKDGAYQDPGFSLGACNNVSPVTGTAVGAGQTSIQAGGSTSRGILYDCGPLSPGDHEVTWKISNGFLTGRITLYADLPTSA